MGRPHHHPDGGLVFGVPYPAFGDFHAERHGAGLDVVTGTGLGVELNHAAQFQFRGFKSQGIAQGGYGRSDIHLIRPGDSHVHGPSALIHILIGIKGYGQMLQRFDQTFRSLDRHKGRFEQHIGQTQGRLVGQGGDVHFQRQHAFGQGVHLQHQTAGRNVHHLVGLEIRQAVHAEGQHVGPLLHLGQIHGIRQIARMQAAQKLARSAQSYGNAVDHTVAHNQPFRQAPIIHPQVELGFHLSAADDHIPQAHGQQQREQDIFDGLPVAFSD